MLRDYGKYTWIFVWVLPVKFDSEVHGANLGNLGNLGNEIEGTSNRGGEEPGLPGLVAGVPSDVSDSEESEGDSVADSEEENSSADADLPEPERRFITYRLQNNWEGEEGQDSQEEGGLAAVIEERAAVIEETAQEAGRNNLEEEDPDVRAEREFLEENDVEMRRNERENENLEVYDVQGDDRDIEDRNVAQPDRQRVQTRCDKSDKLVFMLLLFCRYNSKAIVEGTDLTHMEFSLICVQDMMVKDNVQFMFLILLIL